MVRRDELTSHFYFYPAARILYMNGGGNEPRLIFPHISRFFQVEKLFTQDCICRPTTELYSVHPLQQGQSFSQIKNPHIAAVAFGTCKPNLFDRFFLHFTFSSTAFQFLGPNLYTNNSYESMRPHLFGLKRYLMDVSNSKFYTDNVLKM